MCLSSFISACNKSTNIFTLKHHVQNFPLGNHWTEMIPYLKSSPLHKDIRQVMLWKNNGYSVNLMSICHPYHLSLKKFEYIRLLQGTVKVTDLSLCSKMSPIRSYFLLPDKEIDTDQEPFFIHQITPQDPMAILLHLRKDD